MFRKSVEKVKFSLKYVTRITGILREDQYIFVLVSRLILCGSSNVSDKRCRENGSTHFILGNIFPKIVLSMS